MAEKKDRLLHIEVLRVIAAFLVIFNHTGSLGFTLFQRYESSTFLYWLYLFFSVLCKIGVPLFFMISGALLLRTGSSGGACFVNSSSGGAVSGNSSSGASSSGDFCSGSSPSEASSSEDAGFEASSSEDAGFGASSSGGVGSVTSCSGNSPSGYSYSGKETFKKQLYRILRILAVLVLFSAISWLLQIARGMEVCNLARFFDVLFRSTWLAPYWFLYAYLAFLLILPLLRRLAVHLTDREFRYYLLLAFLLTGVFPVIYFLIFRQKLVLCPGFDLGWLASMILYYPLLGFYLEHRFSSGLEETSRKAGPGRKTGNLVLLWVICISALVLTCLATDLDNHIAGEFTQSYLMSLMPAVVTAVYLTAKIIFESPGGTSPSKKPGIGSGLSKKIIFGISRLTFGIYLMHGWFLLFPEISLINLLHPAFPHLPLCYALLRCLELMILSGLLTWLLKKIPGFRRLL